LVAGSPFLAQPAQDFALALADFWNANLEDWLTVEDTPLARRLGVESYYIRVAPAKVLSDSALLRGTIEIKNRNGNAKVATDEEVGVDFLQLVGFGLRKAMAAMTGPGGMMPEQVWNAADLPERRLSLGKPTGSAMPLAWAHAEFIKLMVSRDLGHPFDRPATVWRRYGGRRPEAKHAIWCLHAPIGSIRHEVALIIALPRAARIHWGINGWQHISDGETKNTGLGLHCLELDAGALSQVQQINFTFQWEDTQLWMRKDFHIAVGSSRTGSNN
jgi:hypothetical protein